MTELPMCALCRETTPERYYGCENPCARYKEEVANIASKQVTKAAKKSADDCLKNS